MNQNQDLESLFRKTFEGFEVKPSAATWRHIEKALYWKKFLYFGFKSFNVYYAGALATVVISGLLISRSPERNILSETQPVSVFQKVESRSEPRLNQESVPTSVHSNPSPRTGTHVADSELRATPSADVAVAGPHASKTQPVSRKSLPSAGPVGEDSPGPVAVASDVNNTPVGLPDLPLESEPKIQPFSQIAPDGEAEVELAMELADVIVYDTIRIKVFDTMRVTVYDTSYAGLSPSLKPRGFRGFSAEVFASPLISQTSYQSKDGQPAPGLDLLSHATTAGTSLALGFKVNYHYGNWLLSAGLGYTRYREEFDEKFISLEVDTMTYTSLIPNGGYLTSDTTDWTFVYDPVGNAYVQVPLIEHYWFPQFDTLVNSFIQTSSYERYFRTRNIYTYWEFPIQLAYSFQRGPFTLEPGFGMVIGHFSSATGKTLVGNDIMPFGKNDLPFSPWLFSWKAGVGISYRINKDLRFVSEPFYRETINSVFKESHPFRQRNKVLGLSVGIRYMF